MSENYDFDTTLSTSSTSSKTSSKNIILIVVIVFVVILFLSLIIYLLFNNTGSNSGSNSGSDSTSDSGSTSGCPKYVTVSPLDISGFNIPDAHYTDKTSDQCIDLCDSVGCDWITYDSTKKECWLKQADSDSDVNSGIKITLQGCPSYSVLKNKDISGSDTPDSPYNFSSESDCQNECTSKKCDWYTYNASENKCWLKVGDAEKSTLFKSKK